MEGRAKGVGRARAMVGRRGLSPSARCGMNHPQPVLTRLNAHPCCTQIADSIIISKWFPSSVSPSTLTEMFSPPTQTPHTQICPSLSDPIIFSTLGYQWTYSLLCLNCSHIPAQGILFFSCKFQRFGLLTSILFSCCFPFGLSFHARLYLQLKRIS